jgi:hypothetical protein
VVERRGRAPLETRVWRGGLAILAVLLVALVGPVDVAHANHQKQQGCYIFEEETACADRQRREGVPGCRPASALAVGCDRRPGVSDPFYTRIFAFVRDELVGMAGDGEQADALRAVGRSIESMFAESKVDLLVHRLPEAVGGVYVPREHFIVVDDRLVTYTPHVVTMILVHELVHAHQEVTGTPTDCFQRESEAYAWQARLWRAWFGEAGKQPPGDDVERGFNSILAVDNRGELRAVIERSPHYRRQCAGR